MNYEYKDLIAQSISAGEYRYAIEDEDYQEYREARVELDHVYVQATKADEYEAKAKAFDLIREARKEVSTDVRERGLKLPTDLDKFSMMTERIINKYESGESE